MKKKMMLLYIMMSCFLIACSGQEHAGEDVYMTADETQSELENTETTQEEMEAERPAFLTEKFVSEEALYSAYLSRTPLEILRFDDMIFVKGDCYEYRDGYYYYLPEQGIEEIALEGRMRGFVTQTRDFLIYLEEVRMDSGWRERVIVVDPYTREQVGCIDLGELLGEEEVWVYATHEDEIYYKINRDNAGDIVGRINCADMSYETIFIADDFIRNITVREDGNVMISVLEEGWFCVEPQGQITLMQEKIDRVWDEYVFWYGESGYHSLIEYYRVVTEHLHIKDDGTRERLYGIGGFEREVYLEDYVINIADDGMLELYDYLYIPLEIDPAREELYYMENIGEYEAFETIQIVEDEIIEAGYTVEEYCICDDTIWLFLRNREKDLVVRSWKVREREEWVREQQI